MSAASPTRSASRAIRAAKVWLLGTEARNAFHQVRLHAETTLHTRVSARSISTACGCSISCCSSAWVLPNWSIIINQLGPWDHTRAVAFCVWVAYPTLGILGLIRPLQWVPLVVFMIFYKLVWDVAVAYPLWRAGALAGSPAEAMANIFVWVPVVGIFVPWKYFFRNYVMWSKPKPVS
jgi:hypothetical protein